MNNKKKTSWESDTQAKCFQAVSHSFPLPLMSDNPLQSDCLTGSKLCSAERAVN